MTNLWIYSIQVREVVADKESTALLDRAKLSQAYGQEQKQGF